MAVLNCFAIRVLALFVCLFCGIYCNKHVLQLTESEFTAVKNNPGVNLVYFYKKSAKRDMVHQQKQFLEEYEKSAKLIDIYNVKFGKVDCPVPGLEEYCNRPEIETHIIVFRNGIELLKLELANMFDIDSIVSNVLQLVLLREVPIVQTVKEFNDIVNAHEGQRDVIISYQHAIGTHAHRVYMEVAFAYQSKYKFTLTTEKRVVEDMLDFKKRDEASLWLVKSSLATKDGSKNHRTYKYREKMDLMELARYVKNLDTELVREVSKGGQEENPFIELDLHTVLMFCDAETRKQTKKQAHEMLDDFYGMIGVLIVNIDRVDATKFGFDPERMTVPALAFQYRRQEVFNIMPANKHPQTFVNNYLSRVSSLDRHVLAGEEFNEVIGGGEEQEEMEDMGDMGGYAPKQSEAEVMRQNDIEMVETQDDHVAAIMYKLRKQKIDRSALPALNDSSFYTEVKDRELLIVLFYLTFDAPSMALLHHFSAASLELAGLNQHPLAAVDCFDWTDVCGKVNVTSYPTVRIYRKGKDMKTYRGLFSREAIVTTALLYLTKSPVHLTSDMEVQSFMAGDLPQGIGSRTSVSVLGLFEPQSQELASFKETASQLEGKFLFGHVTGELAANIAKTKYQTQVPSVVVYRRNDPLKPQSLLTDRLTDSTAVAKFVEFHSLTSFPELSVSNLPAYLSRKLPLVILFASSLETESRELMADMAAAADTPAQVVYCWMNVTSPTSLAHQIMLDYNPAASPPSISLLNRDHGGIYNYNGIEMSRTKITKWITDALGRKIKPSKMLINKEWKPRHPGYDFLKYIEEEEEKKLEAELPLADDSLALPDEEVRSHLKELHHAEERSRFRHKDRKHPDSERSVHEHTEL